MQLCEALGYLRYHVAIIELEVCSLKQIKKTLTKVRVATSDAVV
jgi:hypothetical protein